MLLFHSCVIQDGEAVGILEDDKYYYLSQGWIHRQWCTLCLGPTCCEV